MLTNAVPQTLVSQLSGMLLLDLHLASVLATKELQTILVCNVLFGFMVSTVTGDLVYCVLQAGWVGTQCRKELSRSHHVALTC